jgi:hypothetical protein
VSAYWKVMTKKAVEGVSVLHPTKSHGGRREGVGWDKVKGYRSWIKHQVCMPKYNMPTHSPAFLSADQSEMWIHLQLFKMFKITYSNQRSLSHWVNYTSFLSSLTVCCLFCYNFGLMFYVNLFIIIFIIIYVIIPYVIVILFTFKLYCIVFNCF